MSTHFLYNDLLRTRVGRPCDFDSIVGRAGSLRRIVNPPFPCAHERARRLPEAAEKIREPPDTLKQKHPSL